MNDPYLYDDVPVLKNKLGIKDYDKLRQAEADICFAKLLSVGSIEHDKLDDEYLRAIHKHILGDVFDWAGNYRIVQMEKPEEILGGDTIRYAFPKDIAPQTKQYLKEINKQKWNSMSVTTRAAKFTELFASLWQVHPFRDGNTRSVVAFSAQFAKEKGFPFNFQLLLQNFGYVRKAFVKACDGQYADRSYLQRIIFDAMGGYKEKEENIIE